MFAERSRNQAKTSTEERPKRADAARDRKTAHEPNALWQSLALQHPVAIQAKLSVSQPDDPHEREADHVADQVMRMAPPAPDDFKPSFTHEPSIKAQRKCASCEDEEERKLQRKEGQASAGSTHTAPSVIDAALRSPGQPLDPLTRAAFEPRFANDFGDVRVHTDTSAAQSARSLNALAYTVGSDVVFGAGQYAPDTKEGQRLIAHELTHTIQQKGAQSPGASGPAAGAAPRIGKARSPHAGGLLAQRDAGGAKQSKSGDIDVDVVESFIGDGSPANLQHALEYLNNDIKDDTRLVTVLAKLLQMGLLEKLVKALPQAQNVDVPRLQTLIARARKIQNLTPLHADELGLSGQTFEVNDLSVYVPPGAAKSTENKLHVFFTALEQVTGDRRNDVLTHGLRGASENTDWILIAVPSPGDHPDVPAGEPDFRTIKTSDLQLCMRAVGRDPKIDEIRLSAHSRGYRGLSRTITGNEDPNKPMQGGPIPGPLINLSLVKQVNVLDAFYHNIRYALEQTKTLSNPADPNSQKVRAIDPAKVRIYHVTTSPEVKPIESDITAGTKYRQLGPQMLCIAAMGCLRLIQDTMSMRADVRTALADPANAAVNAQLTKMPAGKYPRHIFSSVDPPPAGKVSIKAFCGQVTFTVAETQKLLDFVNSLDLARGLTFDISLAAHHFFVAEIAHELTE